MDLVLHPKQLEFVNSEAREVFFGGAAGGGKSFVLRATAIIWCMRIPGIQIYLFRRLYKDLLRTHLNGHNSFPMLLREFVEDKIVKINHSSSEIQWNNGSKIILSHIQYESDLDNYLSQEIHVALFDEASTFTEKMYRFIRSRVRIGSLEVPEEWKQKIPFIGLASNPRGPLHTYLKKGFVDPAPYGTIFKARRDDGSMQRQFIQSKLMDNPSLVNNDPDYVQRLEGLGDKDIVAAYLEGDWDAVEGAALEMWDPNHHILENFDIPQSWKIKRGYDYGYSAPYSVLWVAIANGEEYLDHNGDAAWIPAGSIVVCFEMYGDDGSENGLQEDVSLTAQKINRKESVEINHVITTGPADNSIFNAEQGPSIADTMSNEGVHWKRSNKKPGSRVIGLALVRKMLNESLKEHPEKPCLFILRRCQRLAEHLPTLQTDDRTGEDIESTAQPDHDWDTLRYLVLDASNEIRVVEVTGT